MLYPVDLEYQLAESRPCQALNGSVMLLLVELSVAES